MWETPRSVTFGPVSETCFARIDLEKMPCSLITSRAYRNFVWVFTHLASSFLVAQSRLPNEVPDEKISVSAGHHDFDLTEAHRHLHSAENTNTTTLEHSHPPTRRTSLITHPPPYEESESLDELASTRHHFMILRLLTVVDLRARGFSRVSADEGCDETTPPLDSRKNDRGQPTSRLDLPGPASARPGGKQRNCFSNTNKSWKNLFGAVWKGRSTSLPPGGVPWKYATALEAIYRQQYLTTADPQRKSKKKKWVKGPQNEKRNNRTITHEVERKGKGNK